MFNRLGNKPIQRPQRLPREDCQIKIKNSDGGKIISFRGNCSKEQLMLAKEMNNAENIEEDKLND